MVAILDILETDRENSWKANMLKQWYSLPDCEVDFDYKSFVDICAAEFGGRFVIKFGNIDKGIEVGSELKRQLVFPSDEQKLAFLLK